MAKVLSGLTDVGAAYLNNLDMRGAARDTDAYLGLLTVEPDDDGTNYTECSGGNYARAQVTLATIFGDDSTGDSIANTVAVSFGTPNADWGGGSQVIKVGRFAGASGGACLEVYDLGTDKSIQSGDPVSIPIGSLTRSLTNSA